MTPTRETFGNIPVWSQRCFYALAVAAVAVFCWGVWRRFRLWRQGQPVPVRDLVRGSLSAIVAKLKPGAARLLVEGLGQKRVRGRGLASGAHLALFAGFMMLLLGTTLLEVDHLAGMISEHLRFHRGDYYVAYEFVLDVFGLLFVAGCLFFLIRRFARPPSIGHRASDWWVLSAFLGIAVTGYAVEALRIIWQKPVGIAASCSPVGLALASLLNGSSDGQARSAHLWIWWIHSLLVFGFIASIPFTRLLHFVAGPLNLFFARATLGRLEPITMEQVERDERVGVSELRHFTQQQLLSLDACMECGRCEEACPAFATAKPLSPKKVVQDLKGLMSAGFTGSVHETIQAETLWSCTACSACTLVCPVRVDPLTLILDLRRHLVADGGLSGTAAVALRRMQSSANPWGLPQADRANWIEAVQEAPGKPGPN